MTKEVATMKMLKQMLRIALAALFAAMTLLPATLAYNTIGAYYQARPVGYGASYAYGQGFYNYVSPPLAQTRYGAEWHVSNIRTAIYPTYPATYTARIYAPYWGYPYGTSRSPYTFSYRSSGIYGGGGGFSYNYARVA